MSPNSLSCSTCNASLEPILARDLFPLPDNTDYCNAGIECYKCHHLLDLRVEFRNGAVWIESIAVISFPGPEYDVLHSATLNPQPNKLGWYLDMTEATALWKDNHWSPEILTWIYAELPLLCITLKRLASLYQSHCPQKELDLLISALNTQLSKTSKLSLEPFLKNLGPLEISTSHLDMTTRSKPAPRSMETLTERGSTFSAQAYQSYHGRKLDLSWLKSDFPKLMAGLKEIIAVLPDRKL